VRLFAGGTAGAPDAQGAWILPEFFYMQFGQRTFLKGLINGRVTKEGGLLGEQTLQKRFVFDVGLASGAQEIGAAFEAPGLQVFTHTGNQESLARFVETNARTLFDQHANLAQLVLTKLELCYLSLVRGSHAWLFRSAPALCQSRNHPATRALRCSGNPYRDAPTG